MSNGKWLAQVLEEQWQFVVRWEKGNKLRPAEAPSLSNPQATNQRLLWSSASLFTKAGRAAVAGLGEIGA